MHIAHYRERAEENFWFWRPLISDGGMTIDITTLSTEEVLEYNAALDIADEKRKAKTGK